MTFPSDRTDIRWPVNFIQWLKQEQKKANGCEALVCPYCDSVFPPWDKRWHANARSFSKRAVKRRMSCCPACRKPGIATINITILTTLSAYKRKLYADLHGQGWEKERIEKRWAEITEQCNEAQA